MLVYGLFLRFEFLHRSFHPLFTKVDSWNDPYFFFFDKKWGKNSQISIFLFSFWWKFHKNLWKNHKHSWKSHKYLWKTHKISLVMVFSSLLIKEEQIWVISRIQFRVLWVWLGARKSKTDNVAINFPSLGSQRKRIYSFWPMELRAVQLSKKTLDI